MLMEGLEDDVEGPFFSQVSMVLVPCPERALLVTSPCTEPAGEQAGAAGGCEKYPDRLRSATVATRKPDCSGFLRLGGNSCFIYFGSSWRVTIVLL